MSQISLTFFLTAVPLFRQGISRFSNRYCLTSLPALTQTHVKTVLRRCPRSFNSLLYQNRFSTSSPIPLIKMVVKKGAARKSKAKPEVDQSAAEDPKMVEAMLEKGRLIKKRLEEVYPEAPKGFLDHSSPFTLLIAVVLSAQSLDIKVNEVTPELFRLGGTPEKMHNLGEAKIHALIKQIGLAPQKAKNIVKLSESICNNFGGEVPQTFEELESLAGVGHKTASVVMSQAFGMPAFPVDTHIHRLACRWGCGHAKSVEKTEAALKKWFPDPESWGKLHVRIILFGREYCPARKHDMETCPVCSFAATAESMTANEASVTKFVAAVKHKNPYEIRDVPPVDIRHKDKEEKVGKGTKSEMEIKRKGRKRANKADVEEGKEDKNAKRLSASRGRTRRRKSTTNFDGAEDNCEDDFMEDKRGGTERSACAVEGGDGGGKNVVPSRRSRRLEQKKADGDVEGGQ